MKAGLPPQPPGNWPLEGRAGYRGPGLALSLSWVNLPRPEQRLGPDQDPLNYEELKLRACSLSQGVLGLGPRDSQAWRLATGTELAPLHPNQHLLLSAQQKQQQSHRQNGGQLQTTQGLRGGCSSLRLEGPPLLARLEGPPLLTRQEGTESWPDVSEVPGML